jgi:hypothetical protein
LKKTIAILLLGTFLFNLIGYQLMYSFLENLSNNKFEETVSTRSYSEGDLISFKIPIEHLSYYSNSYQYEQASGSMEINGAQYRYVKRRVFNDTLELWCLPNYEAMRIGNAKEEFFRLVSDLEHAGQNKKSDSRPGSSRNLGLEYLVIDELRVPSVCISLSEHTRFPFAVGIKSSYQPCVYQPPKNC